MYNYTGIHIIDTESKKFPAIRHSQTLFFSKISFSRLFLSLTLKAMVLGETPRAEFTSNIIWGRHYEEKYQHFQVNTPPLTSAIQ